MVDNGVALKDFRDNILVRNSVARSFVKFYYEVSQPLADYIEGNESLKATVWIGLIPLMAVSYSTLHFWPSIYINYACLSSCTSNVAYFVLPKEGKVLQRKQLTSNITWKPSIANTSWDISWESLKKVSGG